MKNATAKCYGKSDARSMCYAPHMYMGRVALCDREKKKGRQRGVPEAMTDRRKEAKS